ncbi:MAG: hypothetical protein KDC30_14285, partial [Saprospiraceae bacterium]|nr:hypothetical protein [Saprospiraceae bacterium]
RTRMQHRAVRTLQSDRLTVPVAAEGNPLIAPKKKQRLLERPPLGNLPLKIKQQHPYSKY